MSHCVRPVQRRLLDTVFKDEISESDLAGKLKEAVERADVEAVLEHVAATGRSKEALEVCHALEPRLFGTYCLVVA